jgi:hypothetical protein
MPPRRPEPWASFAVWLRTERDVIPATANNYVSLVRRVIRDLNDEPITPDRLAAYVDALPLQHRSPLRSAWRRFTEWSAQRDTPVIIPTFPTVSTESLPDDVQAAIRVLRQDGITAAVMRTLTWHLETDAHLIAAMPHKTWLRPPPGSKWQAFPLSPSALKALKAWGYPDMEPNIHDPVVPRRPGEHMPMPLATLRRVIKGRTR